MSQQTTSASGDMLDNLFNYCLKKATGTFFVATEDNKSCQIVIEQGDLTKSAFSQLKGVAALMEFKKLKSGRFSFTKNLILPLGDSAKINNSDLVLNRLGIEQFKELQELAKGEYEVAKPNTERKIKSMYRGKPIYETLSDAYLKSTQSADGDITLKKPKRIYRGQVVTD